MSSRRRFRAFELRPRPCGHEHRSFRAVYDCVSRNGVPGFDLVEVPLDFATEVPRGRQ